MKKNILILLFFFPLFLNAQDKKAKSDSTDRSGLKWRSIGPALMSGRVADILIHPDRPNSWLVAVGSGGIWKTDNAGTTWKPAFDQYGSYSIGCLAYDPQNPNRVWAGTGENVGGRHVGYGDGIYLSEDGGASWKNLGLKQSEHISKIIVHPSNSKVIWVAAQGPLWKKGGERGVYKSSDGGKTWKRTLGDSLWTGATDLLIDPRHPDWLYAATWQRHRTVAGYVGGGEGSAIWRSSDGGESWEKLSSGLPVWPMGKIGLALSTQKPDVVYAAIELQRRKGAVYRSDNRGGSWTKMSDAVAGATGPHYYQELYADPNQFDRLYLVDSYMQISDDGGKTFRRMNENNKHVDNHAIAFRAGDPDYLLVGCDGGLYESFDRTVSWKFVANLPVTQFYKIALDDALPYYNIYGGTQDNNTQGGPSRTDNVHGIRNSDWFVVLFGDGHQPATEPGNPNVVYAQWQQGNLMRHDRKSGENIYIQPQPSPGEKAERYNWDAPVLVSPHQPTRIYFASQRVWRSDNRGDTWTPVSGDLTNNVDRMRTSFFEQRQGWDNSWDLYAMSTYSTITSLAESPKKEGLLYAGTDDGVIQVSEDGGKNWRRIPFGALPGLPANAFVNDIKADLYDANTVYAVFDHHKYGDFSPYVYRSGDAGKSWQRITNGVPDRIICWRIVQDHVKKELLFLGTESGVYFSHNGGTSWTQLKSGLPVISVRDLAIQKRENDLVAGTFGRGIYVLDDYSSLREEVPNVEAKLFPARAADWYFPKQILGDDPKASQGDAFYTAENPPYGATFTYFLRDSYKSMKEAREARDKELKKAKKEPQLPSWDSLDAEREQLMPKLWLEISGMDGVLINRVEAGNAKGYQRVSWDLRYASPQMLRPGSTGKAPKGPLVGPGRYKARLVKQENGVYTALTETVEVEVRNRSNRELKGVAPELAAAFWREAENLSATWNALEEQLRTQVSRSNMMLTAYERAVRSDSALLRDLIRLRNELLELDKSMSGSRARAEVGEKNEYPTVDNYFSAAYYGTVNSTYGPTPSHRQYLDYVSKEYDQKRLLSENIRVQRLPELEGRLRALGAPLMEGQGLPQK